MPSARRPRISESWQIGQIDHEETSAGAVTQTLVPRGFQNDVSGGDLTHQKSWRVALLDYVSNHPVIDLVITGVMGMVYSILENSGWVTMSMHDIAPGQRLLIYGAVATVAALAAGSNNTAVGSYVSSSGDVMNALRRSHGLQLRKALRSVGAWLWIVAVASLACLLIDPATEAAPTRTRGADVVFAFAALILILKFARLTLVQDVILKANDLSATHAGAPRRVVRRKPTA